MTNAEIQRIAEEAADKAIKRLFLTFGVNVDSPEAVIEFQSDLKHVRVWRESTEAAKRHALKTIIGVIVSGAVGWLGLIIWNRP